MYQGQYPPANQPQQYPPAVQYPQPVIVSNAYSPQYPPPPQYQPVYQPVYQPPPQSVLVVMQNAPMQGNFGFSSQPTTCSYCHQNISTHTRRTLSATGWMSVIVLFFVFMLFLVPLCCIPCFIPGCYDVKHYCTNCGNFLGMRRR